MMYFKFGHWGTKAALYHSKYKGFKLYREVDQYNNRNAHSWFGVLDGRDEPLHASTRDALKGQINQFWRALS